ncbi:MAG: MFS transporter [Candidatus Helarchaeota archaeon]
MASNLQKQKISKELENFIKIPTKSKINYSIGKMGQSLITSLFAAWTWNYWIKVIGIDTFSWSIAWGIYAVINAVNDPIIGYLSDNLRTKHGRRIPLIRIFAPLMCLSFIFVFYAPIGMTWISNFLWLCISISIYDTIYTTVGLCSLALQTELSINPNERASITIYSSVFEFLGGVFAYLIPFLIINNSLEPYSLNQKPIQIMFISFAIVALCLFIFLMFGVKERLEFSVGEEKVGLLQSLKLSFKRRNFIFWVIFSFLITVVNTLIMNGLSIYVQDVLHLSGIVSFLPLLCILVFGLLGLPIARKAMNYWGMKKAMFLFTFIMVGGFAVLFFINDFVIDLIIFSIIGFGFVGKNLLLMPMLMDIIDEDELSCGIRREGAFYGANALVTKPGESVAAVLFLPTIVAFGYIQGASVQIPSAVIGIKFVMCIIPVFLLIIGLVFLKFYKWNSISPEYFQMKNKVHELHEKKRGRLLIEMKKLIIKKEVE